MFNAKSLLDALVGAAGTGGVSRTGGRGTDLGSLAGQVLDMARQGMGQSGSVPTTGAPGQRPGMGGGDLMGRARDLIGGNQMATGAILGSLGSLVLGSKKGRGLAMDAAKLGGLVLIGGLAYKAYQNYQNGQSVPATSSVPASGPLALPAPSGSGFEPEAASEETTLLLVRAMIAAAAADGHVDDEERARIFGGLKQAGFDPEAATWLDQEFAHPASVRDLALKAPTQEIATEVYTAARLAIDPDHDQEKDFLRKLAGALVLDGELVAHIDAAVDQAKVPVAAGA